jgi:hypothetical protein
MLKTATVKYKTTYQEYDFITDIDLKKGDWVVTDSSNGYTVAEVIAIKELTTKSKRWIVCKIDVTAHKAKMQKEQEISKIRAKLETRRKALQDIEVYNILAQKDEEMAKLLEEYNSMVK